MSLSNHPNVLGGGIPSSLNPDIGNVDGPASSTDNAVVRWDGTNGRLVQNSVLIVADTTGALSGFTSGNGIAFNGGGTLTGASGSLDLAASGTNQNITLTPSGSGEVMVSNTSGASNNAPLNVTGANGAKSIVRVTNNNGAGGFGADANGNALITSENASKATIFNNTGGEVARFAATSGHLLLGGLTTDGTGVLQFPAATTNAGGTNFGTEIYFFRTGTNTAQITASSGLTLSGPQIITGTNTLKFGATAAATIGVSADTTAGVLTFTSPSVGSFSFVGGLVSLGGSAATNSAIADNTTSGGWGLSFPSAANTNGQFFSFGQVTELTTIAASATTDTTIQIPANSIVFSVSVRVTTAITCTTNFNYGVSGATARYGTNVSKAATTTYQGLDDGMRFYGSAISVRFTPDTTPSDATGRVRTTIHYITVTPPTS